MPDVKPVRCGTCRFWVPEKRKGTCHRVPPQPVISLIICGIGWSSWSMPETKPDAWCGEHTPETTNG